MLSAATTTATVGPVATDSGQFCMKVAQGVLVVVVIVNKVLSFVFLEVLERKLDVFRLEFAQYGERFDSNIEDGRVTKVGRKLWGKLFD